MYFGLRLFLLFSGLFSLSPIVCDAACVWRVTASNGNIMYLGGSIHGLSSTDYPIPSAYNHAFDASSRLVFEDSPDVSPATVERFYKSGFYPKNDRLKNHVDPRTYAYLCRIFALWNVPEAQFQRLRPWMLLTALASAATNPLGVEGFLVRRARANRIPVSGLESFHEHMETFSGLSDKQAELVLLETFIPQASGTPTHDQILSAWRRGDVETLARLDKSSFTDLPSFRERILEGRNRNWIPKLEGYMHSGTTYFVVAGAGHMGGPNGVLALLQERGYRIEQI